MHTYSSSPTPFIMMDARKRWYARPAQLAVLVWLVAVFGMLSSTNTALGQLTTAPFIEEEGLIVMEAESVPRSNNWQLESTEEGFAGDGYLRYVGSNKFNEPGSDILEFQIVITNPGKYRMFTFISHLGAPETDQENDVWTKMDDGEWIKTVHGGLYIDLGFSHHTTWVMNGPDGEEFSNPEYELTAGIHTFYISGRSFNVRLDRIHIWKDDQPFQVFYDEAAVNTLPESARDNTILTANPDPLAFSTTAIGGSTTAAIDLTNNGPDAITITDVSISGTDAAQFSESFSGSAQVAGNGTYPLNISFEPTSSGTKTAQASITHSGLNSPLIVNLFGSASSSGSGATVLFRVNAGGPLIEHPLGDWEEDRVQTDAHNVIDAEIGTPHPFVNAIPSGDWSWGQNDDITLDATVPPDTPAEIFNVGRWDPPNNPQLQWDIPVEAGKEIEVRLYFAEIRFTTADDPEGPRVFSVAIDGFVFTGMSDLNLFEAHGHDVGTMKSTVIVSDGNVDIDFVNGTNDPIIMGIEILELGSLSRNMDAGWNMVGVPTTLSDPNYNAVFDEVDLLSIPFNYVNGSYENVTSLTAGEGYWINIGSAASQSFSEDLVQSLTVDLVSGWNMIAGPGCFMPLGSVSDPGNILVEGSLFSYDGQYEASSGLLPGYGYWIQTSNAGSVSMNCASVNKSAHAGSIAKGLDAFGAITFSDANKNAQKLYFGSTLAENIDPARFAMPPGAPEGQFDVRFSSGTWLSEGIGGIALLKGDAYPFAVSLDRGPRQYGGDIYIEELDGNGVIRSTRLDVGSYVSITDKSVRAVRIAQHQEEDNIGLPERFAIDGNYPNPFNPSTRIVLDLPQSSRVNVDVYDLLGRRVLSVPAQQLEAGNGRQILVDASSLSSGTYLYKVRVEMAGETVYGTGRMTLLN